MPPPLEFHKKTRNTQLVLTLSKVTSSGIKEKEPVNNAHSNIPKLKDHPISLGELEGRLETKLVVKINNIIFD